MSFTDRLIKDGVVIFLLHGVTRSYNYEVRNYTGKHVREDDFRALATELKKVGHPLSMDDVIEISLRGEEFPPYSYVLTFDDGFENNYSVALPILEELNTPGLIYVTTSWTEKNGMSWTDRLEYCLENCSGANVRLPWFEEVFQVQDTAAKIDLMNKIRQNVKRDENLVVDDFVEDIFRQCGLASVDCNDDPLDLKLNWQQIQEIHNHPLFTIGGHTHTHCIMSFLPEEECQQEIDTSLGLLRSKSAVETAHFSYPEGLEHTYNERVIQMLKSAGIKCSPSAIDGVNHKGADLFHLRRVMVG